MDRGTGRTFFPSPPQLRRECADGLILRSKYLGFLHEVPEGWEQNRWQRHEAATGQAPELPPLQSGQYLVDALAELRFADSFQGGLRSVSWTEIKAYGELTEAISEPWEARMLKGMSEAYVTGRSLGKQPLAKPPWDGSRLVSAVRMKGR